MSTETSNEYATDKPIQESTACMILEGIVTQEGIEISIISQLKQGELQYAVMIAPVKGQEMIIPAPGIFEANVLAMLLATVQRVNVAS